jgi:hypothetical protein
MALTAGCFLAAFLYAIEGLGQGSLGTNWGDGLATNAAVLKASGASDPNPFFRALLKAPYRCGVGQPCTAPPCTTSLLRSGAGSCQTQ